MNTSIKKVLTPCIGFFALLSTSFCIAQEADATILPSTYEHFTLQEITRVPGIIQENQLDELDENNVTRSITYRDVFGRTTQETLVKGTPDHEDYVQLYRHNRDEYTSGTDIDFNFEQKAYLPITGAFNGKWLYGQNEVQDYYDPEIDCDPNGDIPCDKRPFATITQQESPVRRTIKQLGAGSAWEENETWLRRMVLEESERIPVFSLNENGLPVYQGRDYPSAGLLVNEEVTYPYETNPPQLHRMRTYTNKEGRRIGSKIQAIQRHEDYTHTEAYRFTYQVYNDLGKVAYVFPPHLMHLLNEPGGWRSPTEQELKAYAYHYVYDGYNRLVARTVPGGYTEYTLYDIWDRPVLTQNEKDRAASPPRWSFVKYDDLDRSVVSGKLLTTQTREQLQHALANATVRFELATHTGSNHGYTDASFPTSAHGTREVHSVVYYDNYHFLSQPYFPFQSGYTLAQVYYEGSGHGYQVAATTLGAVTGLKTKVLGQDTYLYGIALYNDDERLVQVTSDNLLGHTNHMNVKYNDFTGEVTETINLYDVEGESFRVKEAFTYDHVGRPLTHTHQIGAAEVVTLARNEYNELGQLVDLKLHSPDENTFAQSIDYRYDIRGQLASINNPDLDDGEEDAFSMQIHRKAGGRGGFFKRLDGLITSVNWKHKGQDHHQFDYDYDPLGQLNKAWFYSLTNGTKGFDFSVGGTGRSGNIEYDLSGNIQSLSRKSLSNIVDDLEYTYEPGSHRLLAVTDHAAESDKVMLFDDQNTTPDDYTYDESGNLISDKNKGITAIRYNDLGFTDQVTFENGMNIRYTYDASGAKLREVVTRSDGSTKQTDYVGNTQYENGTLSKLFHPYGQIKDPTSLTPDYHYFIHDHLGSVRSVVSKMNQPKNIVTRRFSGEAGEAEPDVLNAEVISSNEEERENYYEITPRTSSEIALYIDVPKEGTLTLEAWTWIKGEERFGLEFYDNNSDLEWRGYSGPLDTWQKISFSTTVEGSSVGTYTIKFGTAYSLGIPSGKIQLDDVSITLTPFDGSEPINYFFGAEPWDTVTPDLRGAVIEVNSINPQEGTHFVRLLGEEGDEVRFHFEAPEDGDLAIASWVRGASNLSLEIDREVGENEQQTYQVPEHHWRKIAKTLRMKRSERVTVTFSPHTSDRLFLDDITLAFFVPDPSQSVTDVIDRRDYYPFGGEMDTSIPATLTFLATMEQAEAATEEGIFEGIAQARTVSLAANHTEDGNQAALVDTEHPMGPSLTLYVKAGDTVSMEAYAYYEHGAAASQSAIAAASLSDALSHTLSRSVPSLDGLSMAGSASGNAAPLFQLLGNSGNRPPAAYLNYILFDMDGNVTTEGFVETTEAANFDQERLHLDSMVVEAEGYLFVYLSNETSGDPVFFDDLMVTQHTQVARSRLAAVQDLATSVAVDNRYLFNGKEYVKELGLYDYGYRMYDPWIGRWGTMDPLASITNALSPYHFSMNNPLYFVDPDGRSGCGSYKDPQTGLYHHWCTAPDGADETNNPCAGVDLVTCYEDSGGEVNEVGIQELEEYFGEFGVTLDESIELLNLAYDGIFLEDVVINGERERSGESQEGRAIPIPAPMLLPIIEGLGLGAIAEAIDRAMESADRDIANGVQYTLRVRDTRPMPRLEWGKRAPTGSVQMNAGDVWKIGETTQWDSSTQTQYRYSDQWLRDNNLIFIREYEGNVFQIKSVEKLKLIQYSISNFDLPPGNKIFR
ncbi:MAG: RHS repeat-associated core domain-containing protein [Bacteroidota bacterium]